MPGTVAGGVKASEVNKARHGEDFYRKIGAKGGLAAKGPDYQKGGKKAAGFAANPELAKKAGAIGGSRGKRGPSKRRKPGNSVKPVVVPTQPQGDAAMMSSTMWDKLVSLFRWDKSL